MKNTKDRDKTLTQNELVSLLQAKGFDNVNARLIYEWRAKELLPAFDEIGKGQGKGLGRKENCWRKPRLIIRQALLVLRLQKLYPTYEELYFPLWMSGCSIPTERVRESLSKPLDFMVEGLEETVVESRPQLDDTNSSHSFIEDIIDDAVYTSPFLQNLRSLEETPMPQETIEAWMNVIFNPYYSLNDTNFQEGVQGYEEWRKQTEQRHLQCELTEGNKSSAVIYKDNSFDLIFNHAAFFKENLSLYQLREVMSDCGEECLRELRSDLRVVTKVAAAIGSVISILMQHTREELKPPPSDEFLPAFFSFAKLVAWTSISLRQSGYGEIINYIRRELPKKIRQDFSEENKRKLVEFSPQFAAGFEESRKKMEDSFKNMALNQ